MIERGENDEPRNGLPSLPGTYVLVLRFSKRLEIVVGKLGVLEAQPGIYVYVGSAWGQAVWLPAWAGTADARKPCAGTLITCGPWRRSKRSGTRPERVTGSAGGPRRYARCRGRRCP